MEACMMSRRVGECVFNRLLMLVAKIFAISKGSETLSTTGARELGGRFSLLTADQKPIFFRTAKDLASFLRKR